MQKDRHLMPVYQNKLNRRNVFIMVEGIDNVGKSTLIRNLQKYLNDFTLQMLHYSNVPQESKEKGIEYAKDLYTQMFHIMSQSQRYENSGFICDRSHIGEAVYAPMYRGYCGDFVFDIEKQFNFINSFWDNLFLITLYDDPENVIARDDGLSYSTDLVEKNTEIELFLEAHEHSNIKNKLAVNVKELDADALFEHVKTFIVNS